MKKTYVLLIFLALIAVVVVACSNQATPTNSGPPEEVFWRMAQESLLPGHRIESLAIVRKAECQLSDNTKASFGYVSEWVVEYETVIFDKNRSRTSSDTETRVVALKENGEWVKSGLGSRMCTDR